MHNKMKTFISTTTFAEYDKRPLDILSENNIAYDINPYKRKLTRDEIADILKNKDYVGLLAGTETLDRHVIERAKSLKVISRVGVGIDNIDIQAAGEYDIKVLNTPGVLADAVAELTLGLMLSCLRKISFSDSNIKRGLWNKPMGELLKGKTVGILGFGYIGQRVGALCKAFNAHVLYYDIYVNHVPGFQKMESKDLFMMSDIVTIHISSKETLLDKNTFNILKRGSIIINTSRPSAIDEEALYRALKAGNIAAAGLDVFDKEPYDGKLIEMDNVVLTPHIGSYAREARIDMEISAVNNLVNSLKDVL
jgi:D-3-phosphoglycerate dehydrogenase / 2-oxoglutarate reductase